MQESTAGTINDGKTSNKGSKNVKTYKKIQRDRKNMADAVMKVIGKKRGNEMEVDEKRNTKRSKELEDGQESQTDLLMVDSGNKATV